MVVGLPFVEMVGDIVSSIVGCGVFEIDDDELMVFRSTRRERLFQLEDITILRVVVWSASSPSLAGNLKMYQPRTSGLTTKHPRLPLALLSVHPLDILFDLSFQPVQAELAQEFSALGNTLQRSGRLDGQRDPFSESLPDGGFGPIFEPERVEVDRV
jgi:hypothetical protein